MKKQQYFVAVFFLAVLSSSFMTAFVSKATSEEFDEFAEVFGDDEDDDIDDEDDDMDDDGASRVDFDGSISGKQYLLQNAKKHNVNVHESGLQYQIINSGDTSLGITHPSASDICKL